MSQRTLCIIHEGIGPYNAIAKIAMNQARAALGADWRVTVVAKFLDESLQDEVEWLPLYVLPRLFFVQWVTARHFIRKALGGRQFDVIHAHQPQVADLADVFHCHFLTRIAAERGCMESRKGLGPAVVRLQQWGALWAEDWYYRHWNPRTRMLFCSDLLRQEFARLYGMPALHETMLNAVPPASIPTADERSRARLALVGGDRRLVVGYLGGVQQRKGFDRVLTALAAEEDLVLLMGGLYTESLRDPRLGERLKAVGLVRDLPTFYAACDVLVVPSYFDPCPLVVFEAAAHGVPVIATDGVGNLSALLKYGAGAAWDASTPLGPLVRDLAGRRDEMTEGLSAMADALSQPRQTRRLLEIYDQVALEKNQSASAVEMRSQGMAVP